jgi:uncharacterized cupredoxin-like copper-binding protein
MSSPFGPERRGPFEPEATPRFRTAGLYLRRLAATDRSLALSRFRPAGRSLLALLIAASVSSAAPTSVPASTFAIVRVEMAEFLFRPSVISVQAGRPVRLVFVNRGRLAHQFEAEYLRTLPVRVFDEAILTEAPGANFVRLEPEATASIEFDPRRRGRFAFACTIEGHREAGMRGFLEVR